VTSEVDVPIFSCGGFWRRIKRTERRIDRDLELNEAFNLQETAVAAAVWSKELAVELTVACEWEFGVIGSEFLSQA